MLSKAFSFPLELFQAAPSELELVFFDIPWIEGRGADYLADVGAGYGRYPLREASWEADVRRLAGAIDEADLDLLLVIGDKREFYDTLDHVRRPGCIAYVAQGIDLLYHPNVDFHLHAEREADYFVDGDRMFCGTTRAPFGDDLVFAGRIYYDPRGITPESRRPSRDRDSLMIFHGSLYKALSRPYLETIFGLMQDDADLRFVLMGKDWDGRRAGGAFEAIRELAKQRGVDRRVHYDGAFVAERGGERGEILDPGWQRLRDHLDRARLAPNPWPIGGASSRVEAYLAGVPVPHLAVRTDPESWGRPQHGGGEIPALLVESTTPWSPQEYVEVARRALYDDEFAQQVVLDQLAVAHAVTDPAAYWGQLLGFYRSWAESVEA